MVTARPWMRRRISSERNADLAFLAVTALALAASATVTIVWCVPMSSMNGMSMPGGWTMSMTWMRMPEQSWVDATASLLAMWIVMMTAMMLPSLVPMLRRYRDAVTGVAATRLALLTASASAGYFAVWTLVGIVITPLGFALAELEMQHPALSRAVPIVAGTMVLIAGACQFTTWKARHLACCRELPRRRMLPADTRTAWRHGVRLGLHCSACSAGLTVILLVMGVMDLRVMAAVATAITAERLAASGERVAQAVGVIVIGAGAFLLARAAALR